MLIDFWTYTCINCIRTLPQLRALGCPLPPRGLTIVGVHTPEFSLRARGRQRPPRDRRTGIRYPVAQDNDYGTWNAWGNQYWPAKYLVDAEGRVRYTHFGEGEYGQTEAAIRALLAEPATAPPGSARGRAPAARSPRTLS